MARQVGRLTCLAACIARAMAAPQFTLPPLTPLSIAGDPASSTSISLASLSTATTSAPPTTTSAVAIPTSTGALYEPPGNQVILGAWVDQAINYSDTPAQVNARLERNFGMFQQTQEIPLVPYNFTLGAGGQGSELLIAATNTSAALFLTVYPVNITAVQPVDLEALGYQCQSYIEQGRPTFIRFAPEMQGPWMPYGVQPTEYIVMWQAMYRAVKAVSPNCALVWGPNIGSGYPYGVTLGEIPNVADQRALDTNNDGVLDSSDDPFTPYYPGDDYTDWHAVSLYYKGPNGGMSYNQAQPGGFVASLLAGSDPTTGADSGYNFYQTYCANKPNKACMLGESGAAYHVTSDGDASQLQLQQAWWQDCLTNATFFDAHPRLKGIMMFEFLKEEYDTGTADLRDYRITNATNILSAFQSDLSSVATRYAWASATTILNACPSSVNLLGVVTTISGTVLTVYETPCASLPPVTSTATTSSAAQPSLTALDPAAAARMTSSTTSGSFATFSALGSAPSVQHSNSALFITASVFLASTLGFNAGSLSDVGSKDPSLEPVESVVAESAPPATRRPTRSRQRPVSSAASAASTAETVNPLVAALDAHKERDPLLTEELAVGFIEMTPSGKLTTSHEDRLPPPPAVKGSVQSYVQSAVAHKRASMGSGKSHNDALTLSRTKPTTAIKFSPLKGTRRARRAEGEPKSDDLSSADTPEPENGIMNNDFCDACKGKGHFLCCEACPRSFHFSCLDPPLELSDLPENSWYCCTCLFSRRKTVVAIPSEAGPFTTLMTKVAKSNVTEFSLPASIRTFCKDVASRENGDFMDLVEHKPAKKTGVEERDPYKLKSKSGASVLCFRCKGAASSPSKPILSCDFCDQHWHLDCLDPPMASMPAPTKRWMCPTHPAHVQAKRKRARNTPVVAISKPGQRNNGDIDIVPGRFSRYFDQEVDYDRMNVNGVRYQVPEDAIILDFWTKAKDARSFRRVRGNTNQGALSQLAELQSTFQRQREEDSESLSTLSDLSDFVLNNFPTAPHLAAPVSDGGPPSADMDAEPDQASISPILAQAVLQRVQSPAEALPTPDNSSESSDETAGVKVNGQPKSPFDGRRVVGRTIYGATTPNSITSGSPTRRAQSSKPDSATVSNGKPHPSETIDRAPSAESALPAPEDGILGIDNAQDARPQSNAKKPRHPLKIRLSLKSKGSARASPEFEEHPVVQDTPVASTSSSTDAVPEGRPRRVTKRTRLSPPAVIQPPRRKRPSKPRFSKPAASSAPAPVPMTTDSTPPPMTSLRIDDVLPSSGPHLTAERSPAAARRSRAGKEPSAGLSTGSNRPTASQASGSPSGLPANESGSQGRSQSPIALTDETGVMAPHSGTTMRSATLDDEPHNLGMDSKAALAQVTGLLQDEDYAMQEDDTLKYLAAPAYVDGATN
ncbi:glycoside hydrolase family 26 protein [Mixia osmundae IAM 14324]|uniref:PHD-type domain-containing protein n=1 Tax=Mixia osmundae (strain CBS 9802 / IAM 14324 / JCM 22182 / KY 12970) TaxID=764103 RepID=G7DW64_MIXOS|nr:glycoside hydrolase family 26 protein [Mixia osmundae IAM 14324]KEI36433.1 glycoside hydrolase family 26 protein [Mixia osmundae IAM 14324]GAA94870.1 hypothetical protein E5Q_01524 [Mixia osmundae IAM 14324]